MIDRIFGTKTESFRSSEFWAGICRPGRPVCSANRPPRLHRRFLYRPEQAATGTAASPSHRTRPFGHRTRCWICFRLVPVKLFHHVPALHVRPSPHSMAVLCKADFDIRVRLEINPHTPEVWLVGHLVLSLSSLVAKKVHRKGPRYFSIHGSKTGWGFSSLTIVKGSALLERRRAP